MARATRKARPPWLREANANELAQVGFTCIQDLCSPEDLAVLRAELPRLFAERAGGHEGSCYDMLDTHGPQLGTLPTMLNPSNYSRALRRLECRERANAVARWLLGDEVVLNLEHAILKPARVGAPTPWHQDEAYRREPEFRYNQVTFWFPLHDVTDQSGCLRFVPGSNLGEVREHRSYRDDPESYALECVEEPLGEHVVVQPVKAGDCSVHSGRTLHGAGPNLSARDRFAYILEFEAPPVRLSTSRTFAWHHDRTPGGSTRRRWLIRGGVFVEAMRRLRGGLFSATRWQFELRRTLRVAKDLFR